MCQFSGVDIITHTPLIQLQTYDFQNKKELKKKKEILK